MRPYLVLRVELLLWVVILDHGYGVVGRLVGRSTAGYAPLLPSPLTARTICRECILATSH